VKRATLAATLLLLLTSTAPAEIHFLRGPVAEAMKQANEQQKPVMIDFMTDWCRWCDTLDANTYSDPQVAGFVDSNLVALKIDAEKGEGVVLAKKYGVRGYPTILLARANGEEIDRLVGYLPPDAFLRAVKDFVHGVNTLLSYTESVAKTPDDASLRYALAKKYAERNDLAGSAEQYKALLRLDPNNALGHDEEARFTVAAAALVADNDNGPLVAFLDRYPNSPAARNALANLFGHAIRLKDSTHAREFFDRYTGRWPNDAGAMNSYAWNCAEQDINLGHAALVAKKAVTLAASSGEKAAYLDTYATVQFKLGKIDDAISLEEQALQLLKNSPPKSRREYEETLARFTAAKNAKKRR
jgi:thioredoxin 1